jgi:hypothetical protein
MLYFEGIAHPEAKSDDYNGLMWLNEKEMNKIAKNLVGVPILLEHDGNITEDRFIDESKSIGKIVNAKVDEKNRLAIRAYIDRRTPRGARAAIDLKEKKLPKLYLSNGTRHYLDERLSVIDKSIQEISITSDPELSGTEIYYVKPDTQEFLGTQKFVETLVKRREAETSLLNHLFSKSKMASNNSDTQTTASSTSGGGGGGEQATSSQQQQQQLQRIGAPEVIALQEQIQRYLKAEEDYKKQTEDYKKQTAELEVLKKQEEEKRKLKEDKKRRRIADKQEEVIQIVTSILNDAGVKNPKDHKFYKAVENIKSIDPSAAQPVMDFVTCCSDAHKKRAKTQEDELNQMRQKLKENEEKIKKFDLQESLSLKKPQIASSTTTATTAATNNKPQLQFYHEPTLYTIENKQVKAVPPTTGSFCAQASPGDHSFLLSALMANR